MPTNRMGASLVKIIVSHRLARGALLGASVSLACSGTELPDSNPTGGSGPIAGSPATTGGGGASAGSPSFGGAPAGAPSVAGASSGAGSMNGGSSTGGMSATGGRPSGGQAGASGMASSGGPGMAGMGSGGRSNTAGTGGMGTTAGTGGSGGMGTAGGGGKAAPIRSAGCGKANPQTGSGSNPLMVSGHQYYVKLPGNYDAEKAYPVIFMFNPTNNPITWAEQSAGFEQNGAKDAAIRVYPHPANPSSGWGANDVAFFQPLYDQITANFCTDKARMFAAGESSGGDFSSILGCEHADKIRAIGPCATKNVNQYPLTASTRKCTGQVTAVIIHGKMDSVVGSENGPKTANFYREINGCGTMSMGVQGYTDTLSNCLQYQGCDPGYDVYFCQHTDPNYSNTNHGWPAFAPKMLWQVFSSF